MVDVNKIDELIANANDLAKRKFGVDISGDSRIDPIANELAEAATRRAVDHKWPVQQPTP